MAKVILKNNERIIVEIRRYGLTYFWSWFSMSVLFGVPFFFLFWLMQHGWWGQALFVIPVTIAVLFLVRTVFMIYKNVTVLTTHRIVDRDQHGFFQRDMSDIPYDQIEEVSSSVSGFFGTIFNYGSVVIDTGSKHSLVVLDRVRKPTDTQRVINDARKKYLSVYAHEFSDDVADVIIEKLHELELPELLRVQKALQDHIEKRK